MIKLWKGFSRAQIIAIVVSVCALGLEIYVIGWGWSSSVQRSNAEQAKEEPSFADKMRSQQVLYGMLYAGQPAFWDASHPQFLTTQILAANAFAGTNFSSSDFADSNSTEANFANKISAGQAVFVEELSGQKVETGRANERFHPASTIKLATAYAALSQFGPDYSFKTVVSTDGIIEQNSGTLRGNLYVWGSDPSFHAENAVELAREMNKLGIRRVTGRIFVSKSFTLQWAPTAEAAASALRRALNVRTRACETAAAFSTTQNQDAGIYSVEVLGPAGLYSELDNVLLSVSSQARTQYLLTHNSPPLKSILKAMLSYSDNFMAESLGAVMGGPKQVERYLVAVLGLYSGEIHLQSTSGLGNVYITPRAMMLVLRALHGELERNGLAFVDILPVAGVDEGTLSKRFVESNRQGTVVAKTGTLGHDFGGVSALAGIANTAQGAVFFVIFDRGGKVSNFRRRQDRLVKAIQDRFGGPARLAYKRLRLAITMRPRCGR